MVFEETMSCVPIAEDERLSAASAAAMLIVGSTIRTMGVPSMMLRAAIYCEPDVFALTRQ